MARILPSRQSPQGKLVRKRARQEQDRRAARCAEQGCNNIARNGHTLCGRCISALEKPDLEAEIRGLETLLFHFLCRKYTQRSDERQKMMGLQYTTAETHDLAEEISRFLLTLDLDGEGGRLKVEELREALKDV